MTYTVNFVIALFGSAVCAGFLGALLGVGGGVIVVPVMVLMFHLPMKIAVATSIVSVIATSNAGGSKYVDQHITNLRLAMFLEIATTLGALSGAAISFTAGVASGLLGVGGGVLKVSAMNRYMNVPMKVAVGTSKLMIGVTACVGSILFFMAGLIHFAVVAPVALGTTAGATLGTMIMNRLKSASLKWIFAALMLYLAYGMIARALAIAWNIHLPNLT